MKRETAFLKAVIYLIGAAVLGLCLFWLPGLAYRMLKSNLIIFAIAMIMLISVIPFEMALYQALKILKYIDKNEAFSELSVKAFSNIRNCAVAISFLYTAGLPLLYIFADKEDAPGILLVGIIITGISFVVAVFAAVLQKLLKNVIEIKSENDLTV